MTEQFQQRINQQFLHRSPQLILDIGTRDLYQSRELALAYPQATVWAFEPHPESYQNCLVELATCPRTRVFNLALSDHRGQLPFYMVEGNPGGSSLLKPIDVPHGYGYTTTEVEVVRLDDLLDSEGGAQPDVVWMDVQGLELSVLKGMGRYLGGIQAMHIEACPKAYYEGHQLQSELEDYLHSQGFATEFVAHHNHPHGEGDLICTRQPRVYPNRLLIGAHS